VGRTIAGKLAIPEAACLCFLALQPETGVKTLVLGLKSFEPPDFVEDVVNQML
jgi:hypothetical protein